MIDLLDYTECTDPFNLVQISEMVTYPLQELNTYCIYIYSFPGFLMTYMYLFFSRIFDDLVNLAPPLISDEEDSTETASESSFASGIYCFHDPGFVYKDLFMCLVILLFLFFFFLKIQCILGLISFPFQI